MEPQQNSPAVSTKRASIIGQMWRGELPLWISFWFFSFLGNIVIFNIWQAAARIFASLVERPEPFFLGPTGLLVCAIGLKFLSLGYIFFVCVGVWRSAGKYTGHKILGLAAKVLVSFYLLKWVFDTFLKGLL